MEALDRQRQLERELLDTMDRKVRNQDRLLAMKDATIAELQLRLTSLEQTSYDGTLLWRITDFQNKRQDAVSGRVTSIYSSPFFTSRTGKMTFTRVSHCFQQSTLDTYCIHHLPNHVSFFYMYHPQHGQ